MASCTQIDHQIQPYLDGELSQADRAIFDRHLSECNACGRLLVEQQRNHADLFETLAEERLPRDLRDYVLSHLPEMETASADMARLTERVKHPSPIRERAYRLMPLAAAVLLIVLAALIKARWPVAGVSPDAVGMVAGVSGPVSRIAADSGARSRARERVWAQPGDRFETEAEGRASILIAGPTELLMAPNTSLRVDSERQLTIERGRVFLDVAPGDSMYTVFTPMGEVTVFGTRFDVEADADRTTVIVEQGRVQLSHHDHPRLFRMITPNQRAYVARGLDEVPVDTVDALIECAWANGSVANPEVREFFAERVQPARETQKVSGEGGYFLQTNGQPLRSLIVTWSEASPSARYGDMDVFVYAPDNRSVFRGEIPGAVFSDPRRNEIEIPNTGDTGSGYSTVFVKIVPAGNFEGGRVEIRSVSGRIGKEPR